jgi:hypothetical protein
VRGNGGGHLADQEDEMINEMFSLYAMGVLHARPPDMSGAAADLQPWQMEPVVRLGILRGDYHFPTCHHAGINLDTFATRVVRYLDGDTAKADLLSKLMADFEPGGDLAEMVDSNMPAEKVKAHLERSLEQLLNLFRKHGVLG